MIIKLTEAHMRLAANLGVERRLAALSGGLDGRYGVATADNWERDINGCLAELAVAHYLNLFWCGTIKQTKERDAGALVDVRSIDRPDRRLILHPGDPDAVPFVLVHVRAPVCDLIGWMYASEGKQQQWWADPTGAGRAAFFVPQEEVRKRRMEGLREWVAQHRPFGIAS